MDHSKSLCMELGSGLWEFVQSFWQTLKDLWSLVKKAKESLPIFWYITVGLSIAPICCDIPKSGVIPFLFAYCVSSLVICFSDNKKKAQVTKPQDTSSKTNLLSGVKISQP